MKPLSSRMIIVGLGVALVLTTTGATAAVAAGLIGSADIKNNSIQSIDVKDGTLELKDLRPELQAQITQAGPVNPSIAGTFNFVGPVASIVGNSGNYAFAGPPAQVTTDEKHRRVTGAANAPLGLAAGSAPQISDVGFCYQPAAGGTLVNFVGSNFSQQYFTAQRAVYAASSTVMLPVGTWRVGMCVRNNGTATISNNSYVEGWLQVTS